MTLTEHVRRGPPLPGEAPNLYREDEPRTHRRRSNTQYLLLKIAYRSAPFAIACREVAAEQCLPCRAARLKPSATIP